MLRELLGLVHPLLHGPSRGCGGQTAQRRFTELHRHAAAHLAHGVDDLVHGYGVGRILTLTLPVGSSIGLHTHTGNCEIIHVLSGSGVCHDDGTDVPLTAGMTHYCPEGHTHGIDNTGAEPLVLLGILPDVK